MWNNPIEPAEVLKGFDYVTTPDFSMYIDIPKALQIFNHYRKHWCGAFWQAQGINVIPTIWWSDKKSFEWCFDGEPKNSVVWVSSVGIMDNDEKKRYFMAGYNEMKKRLNPSKIWLCFAKMKQFHSNQLFHIIQST